MMKRRLIITKSDICTGGCSGCYYAWRDRSDRMIDVQGLIDEHINVAVGLNYDPSDDEYKLAATMLEHKKNVIITTPLSNVNVIEDLLRYGRPEMVAVSLVDHITKDDVNSILRLMKMCPITLSIMHDSDAISSLIGILPKELNIPIYILIRKDTIKVDGSGWQMTTDVIRDCCNAHVRLFIEGYLPRIDECAFSILENEKGNCSGSWLEVGPMGEIRPCPYTDTYHEVDTTYDVPPCRRGRL